MSRKKKFFEEKRGSEKNKTPDTTRMTGNKTSGFLNQLRCSCNLLSSFVKKRLARSLDSRAGAIDLPQRHGDTEKNQKVFSASPRLCGEYLFVRHEDERLLKAEDKNRIPNFRNRFLLPVKLKVPFLRHICSVKQRSADGHGTPKRGQALELEDAGVDVARVTNGVTWQVVVRDLVVVRARLSEVRQPDSADPVLVHIALQPL